MKFCGAVIDATTGRGIVYPWPRDTRVMWRFDLVVRTGDEWCYMASSNDLNSETIRHTAQSVEGNGGIWRIVEAGTGEIVRRNPAAELCLN